MSGTNIEQASDRALRQELNAYLEAVAAQERRAELIEEQAQYLIQPGQEFYPWTFARFEEAIGNAPNGDRIAIFATIAAAVDLKLSNHLSNHMALSAVKQTVEKYWLACAKHEAEKNG